MRIGIIAPHMSFDQHGGANYSRHRVAQELQERGHEVTVYTLNFSDENHIPVDYDYTLTETRIDAYTVYDGVVRFFSKMDTYFKNNDVIHVYVPGIIPLVALYKELTGADTPLFGTLNGYTPFCTNTAIMSDGCWSDCSLADKVNHSKQEPAGDFTYGSFARFVFNNYATDRLLSKCDKLFCLSPAVATIYEEVGVDPAVLEVSPNVIDTTFKSESEPDKPLVEVPDGGKGEVRILYVGRVDAMKSISNLLEGIQNMQSVDFRVDIVGDNILNYGKSLLGYRQEAKERGIDDVVTFHGWVDYTNLSSYYADADIFVHAAEWPEPFGRTIIEAMQHGLPIVCSDVGAPPWVSGAAGISYPKRDTTALGEQLDALVRDDRRRQNMSQNTQIELERFEPDVVITQIEETYKSAL